MLQNNQNTQCGFVALVGAPNAGKSTLTNALVGQHVTIVSSKVQTTRFPVRGIVMEGNTQIVLVDTPGVFTPKESSSDLDHAMVNSALQSASDADVILYMVDATLAVRSLDKALPEALDLKGKNVSLILNKVDKIDKEKLLHLAQTINERYDFQDTYMISATQKSGLQALVKNLAQAMPESPFLFPEDQISDLPMKLYAAERTREAAFERLNKEVPYGLMVETDIVENVNDENKKLVIKQTIFIKEDRHKPIILGHKGKTIKEIGMASRIAMEEDMERKIHLSLFVKVKKGWDHSAQILNSWGIG